MALLHLFPDHLVAEIAKHLDAAIDVLNLESALEAASSPPTKTTTTTTNSRSSSRSQGHSSVTQKEALSSSSNPRYGVKTDTLCFQEQKKTGARQEGPSRELDASDDDVDDENEKNVNSKDENVLVAPPTTNTNTPTIPTPPAPSLLEEVLRLRWRDAWVLSGIPRSAGIEAGVACAYAAALASAPGGPAVRSCALAGYSTSNPPKSPGLSSSFAAAEGSDDESMAAEAAQSRTPTPLLSS